MVQGKSLSFIYRLKDAHHSTAHGKQCYKCGITFKLTDYIFSKLTYKTNRKFYHEACARLVNLID